MLQTITAVQARDMVAKGAVLVDVREADEYAREHIPGARHTALSKMSGEHSAPAGTTVVFHCKSGARTLANAGALRQAVPGEAYLLEGGLEAWKASGFPVNVDRTQPIEIMRQVQITAGSLVLLGVLLALTLHPGWIGLSAFVGAGLVFAGVSGWCGMAKLLAIMPWNRR